MAIDDTPFGKVRIRKIVGEPSSTLMLGDGTSLSANPDGSFFVTPAVAGLLRSAGFESDNPRLARS